MKNKYIRLKAILLAGTIALTSPSLTACSNKDSETNSNQEIIAQDSTMHFGVGEHIISVPISPKNDIRFNNVQYDYYPGYEPIGISITAHGMFDNDFGGGAIIYANIEEVDCSSRLVDKNGNYLYLDFGTPTYYTEDEYNVKGNIKEFNVGEHIISVPISEDNRFDYFQYEYRDGYEVVGIATSAHGKFDNDFGGGVLLYKNITPIKCVREDNGYTSFGIPIEKENTKKLK